ncbi:MBL fold metallo-hydrolase [Halobaculum sp. CBA1158]|uniref:MBL fold metallo-hydrolase n=1 Tax=Halobaculum sp. CBA1158 TaxID=2904243 RepID=UPI001F3014F4|nr:MBL fold metallo-hydrolase [Halobaculum sp. CBA1158]UIO98758.1 MBL fold metallo-hydrolase [Halobaculum sp. CBA1158]
MRVTFLGTGSAMPVADRVQTGLLVEAAPGDRSPLLVDCGAGVLHRLSQTDPGYEAVSTVLLTHHHLDHVSDLLALLKARWLAGEERLHVVGPPGTKALLDDLLDVGEFEYLDGRAEVSVREVHAGTEFSLAGLDVEAFETRHSKPCLAYRFSDRESEAGGAGNEVGEREGETAADGGDAAGDDPGRDPAAADSTDDEPTDGGQVGGDFVFSGDSEAFAGLANFAEGARVLAHDCSFPDEVDVDNHPTPTQLGEALAGRDIDRVYLTHLYPHTEGRHEEMLESVTRHFDGDVRVARDGLRFEP